jgi:hypothetical protein
MNQEKANGELGLPFISLGVFVWEIKIIILEILLPGILLPGILFLSTCLVKE